MKLPIKNALISVYNKEGIINFAKELSKFGVNIIATSGTASKLSENGIKVRKVEEVARSPELLGGRIKTLQPEIFAAILADRRKEEHLTQLNSFGLDPIDLVVVNLYPFEYGKRKSLEEEELIELIDIGGASLLRAGAKNYKFCVVLMSSSDYGGFLQEMRSNKGKVSLSYRKKQSQKVFQLLYHYNKEIADYFSKSSHEEKELFPDTFSVDLRKVTDLRYGENPHQKSALYRGVEGGISLVDADILSGKLMSYNNWMDADAAIGVVSEFAKPAVSIVKHAAPCGVGIGNNILEAFDKAYKTDPVSSFGGIIVANRGIDLKTAENITSSFFEVIIAPSYKKEALKKLKEKKNLRILKVDQTIFSPSPFLRCYPIKGGVLLQETDCKVSEVDEWKVVSDREPTQEELKALDFTWKVAKWVKSNGIVLGKGDRTIGIGTGQPSRVDSVKLAVKKAKLLGHSTVDTVLASDGFFPFRDSIDEAKKAGVTAVVEPGGSIRDKEVITVANENRMSLLFTGVRHFRH